MSLSRAQAGYLLTLLKGRALVLFEDDKKRAHSPFPYDKKFFDKLRADQVPRFLRCISDPWKLPLVVLRFDKLYALQDRVEVDKVESIREAPGMKPSVVVRIRDGGKDYIADGLHRTTAEWLNGMEDATFHYADLSKKTEDVEPVPGAGKFDREAESAGYRSIDGSER